ncbi:hypothetical protein GN958_ATG11456 [Phytophthora infestans]|uniref:Uncharacterized protein n=1 Tax=Phytophthora infestans TaxID=4787 RepID=A0A8S9UER0_PHYIN|nr:hypothetical protein GN958_ATG11456 [Phytophthora infestans]
MEWGYAPQLDDFDDPDEEYYLKYMEEDGTNPAKRRHGGSAAERRPRQGVSTRFGKKRLMKNYFGTNPTYDDRGLECAAASLRRL